LNPDNQVRVFDENDAALGIMSFDEAQAIATESE
jgi:translation initiation factor IF-3